MSNIKAAFSELEYQRNIALARNLELAVKYQDVLDRALKAESRVKELEAEAVKTVPVDKANMAADAPIGAGLNGAAPKPADDVQLDANNI